MKRIKLLALVSTLTGCLISNMAWAQKTPEPKKEMQAVFNQETRVAPDYVKQLKEQASGFSVGQAMSARTVYVMFDPQCPHCAELWGQSQPLLKNTHFVWIPIAFINAKSIYQGAAILADKSPAEKMKEHESLLGTQGGLKVTLGNKSLDAQVAMMKKNTDLFAKSGARSVPFMVYQRKDGTVITNSGALPTEGIRKLLAD